MKTTLAMPTFLSANDLVRELATTAYEPSAAGVVRPVFRGEFASVGVLRLRAGAPRGLHRQPTHEELLMVLDGEGDFRVGDRVHRVRQGDFIVVPPGVQHGNEAIRSESLSLLSVITPDFDLVRDVVWDEPGGPLDLPFSWGR